MRATRSMCGALFALGAVAFLGCDGGGGGGDGAQAADTKAPSVTVTEDKGGSARLYVTNDTESTIAIFAAGLEGTGGAGVAEALNGRLTEAGGFAIDWTLLVDDPGPQARAPMPPRLEKKDLGTVAYSAPVLAPGQSWIGPKMPKSDRTSARLSFRRLKRPVKRIELTGARREPLPAPEGPRTFGWVPVERFVLDTKAATVAEGAPDQRFWVRFKAPVASGDPLALSPAVNVPLPKLHKYLAAEDELGALEHKDVPLR